ncbi:hypothetical protein PI125_g22108 [Phytophthora idaei]|nr:hypothetical protein PI125_g22108 [Phytophthora idaei]
MEHLDGVCQQPTRVAAAAVDRNGPKQFPIFQLAHKETFQVLWAHSTKRVAQRNKIPRQKKAVTAGTHISGRRKNLLCSVALSVIKARAQAVSESPVKFAVAEDSRIFVNSSNEKRIATCITLQTKHMVDIFNRFPSDDRNLNNCNYNALKKSKFKISRVPPEVRFFFTIDTTDGVVYKCNNYSETPACAVNTGYTNLHKHLTKCIGKDHDAKYASAVKARRNGLGFEVIEYVSERDLTVFKWIVWVLMRNMSLSEVDNPLTRELAGISSSDHVSSRSLSTYIKYLVPLVEALVEKILPLPFGVMLDGWTTKSTHYVAVPEDQSRAVEQ